jgi:hypothetical protein
MVEKCVMIGRTGKPCKHPRYNGTDKCAYHNGLRGPALRQYQQTVKMARQLARAVNQKPEPRPEDTMAEAIKKALLRPGRN